MKKQILRGLGTGLILVATIMLIFYAPVAWRWVLDLRHLSISKLIVLGMVYAPVVLGIVLGSNLRIRNK